MTEQLHRLIDSGAQQAAINERIAALLERDVIITGDHEKRIRFLEKTVNYALGAVGAIALLFELVRALVK